jgi:YVTN family beta-propeller protein
VLSGVLALLLLGGAAPASADAVVSTVPLPDGANPLNAVVSSDSTTLYVTASSSVLVIDVASGTVTATVPVGSSPQGLALSPDSRLLVTANAGSASVTVIDVATNAVLGTVAAGTGAFDVVISPDSLFAYVANQVSSPPTVSIIDLTTLTNVGSISGVGSYPTGIALTADGSTLVTGNYLGESATLIDVATRTVVASVPLGTAGSRVSISPDDASAYMINPDASMVSVIDLATRTLAGTVPTAAQPWAVRFAAGGQSAYVAHLNTAQVTVIDVASATTLPSTPLTTGASTLAVAPDGSRLFAGHPGGIDFDGPGTPPYISVIVLSPVIASAAPPAAIAGAPYSFRFATTGFPIFALASGTLPPGLDLDTATGEISGTPTVAGSFAFAITATNDGGSSSASFSMTVSPAAAGGPALAATGVDVAGGAALALGLLALGAVARATGRRVA